MFLLLPEAIQLYILSHITLFEDLLTIRSVSKSFIKLASQARYHLTFKDKHLNSALHWKNLFQILFDEYPFITHLTIRRCDVNEVAFIYLFHMLRKKDKQSLKSLILSECRFLSNKTENWLLFFIQSLEIFSIARCPRLNDSVCNWGSSNFRSIKMAPNAFQNLKCLLLDPLLSQCSSAYKRYPNILNQWFGGKLNHRFPHLETLALIHTPLFMISLDFLRYLPSLKYLFLGNSTFYDYNICRHLFGYDLNQAQTDILLDCNEFENWTYFYDTYLDIAKGMGVPLQPCLDILDAHLREIEIFAYLIQEKNDFSLLELTFHGQNEYGMNLFSVIQMKLLKNIQSFINSRDFLHLNINHGEKYDGKELQNKENSKPFIFVDLSVCPNSMHWKSLHDILLLYPDCKPGLEFAIDNIQKNGSMESLLHITSRNNDAKYMLELLENGAYVDRRDSRGITALWRATYAGNLECCQYLLQFGADALSRKTKETPLEIACMHCNTDIIQAMIECTPIEKLDNTKIYNDRWTPIHCICIARDANILQLLLNYGLKFAEQNRYGLTPLHICANQNIIECAAILLPIYSYEQLMIEEEYGRTALKIAKWKRNFGVVELIERRMYELSFISNEFQENRNEFHGNKNQSFRNNERWNSNSDFYRNEQSYGQKRNHGQYDNALFLESNGVKRNMNNNWRNNCVNENTVGGQYVNGDYNYNRSNRYAQRQRWNGNFDNQNNDGSTGNRNKFRKRKKRNKNMSKKQKNKPKYYYRKKI